MEYWPIAVVMVTTLVCIALTGFLRLWIAHRERMTDARQVNHIEELSAAFDAHKAEVKVSVSVLTEKLVQLANRRQ